MPPETDVVILCKNRGIGIEPFLLVAPEILTEETLISLTSQIAKSGIVVDIYAFPVKFESYMRLYSSKEGLLCGRKSNMSRAKKKTVRKRKREKVPELSSAPAPNAETKKSPSPSSEVLNSASASA